MVSNWAANLDMLAQEGILNYDAPAYIMGQPPRYAGSPQTMQPFLGPIPQAPLINQPQPAADMFNKPLNNKGYVKNPAWKKWLFGIITTGLVVAGGYKFKKTLIPYLRKLSKNFNIEKTKKAVSDFFSNSWKKLTKLFKSKNKKVN